jgi:hypothetical protein
MPESGPVVPNAPAVCRISFYSLLSLCNLARKSGRDHRWGVEGVVSELKAERVAGRIPERSPRVTSLRGAHQRKERGLRSG